MITLKAVITEAIKQAVKDVGYDNLDRRAFFNAVNKLTSVDTWGNTGALGFDLDKRIGVSTMKMARYTKNGRISVSEWIELPRTFEGKDR